MSVEPLKEGVTFTNVAPKVTSRGTADIEEHVKATVQISLNDLMALDAAGKSAAAGLARVSTAALARHIAAGAPLVLGVYPKLADAKLHRERLRAAGNLPLSTTAAPGCTPFAISSVFAIAALVTFPIAIYLPFLWIFSVVSAGIGLTAGIGAYNATRNHAEAQASWQRRREFTAGDARLDEAQEKIAEIRRRLLATDWPAAAVADVRQSVLDVEARIEGLVQAITLVDRGPVDAQLAARREQAESDLAAAFAALNDVNQQLASGAQPLLSETALPTDDSVAKLKQRVALARRSEVR